ncbi:hypothetical protein VP01_3290g1 [Puccinia sorghi]|uniref:Uncharacterized protein n=1 Tax=Puccinia sorghi TaxID=27349 RepID=A0A0L6UXJ5_9BASI|nr:hypothetical protein VP01_3290g1 [Puccinia sorghi]
MAPIRNAPGSDTPDWSNPTKSHGPKDQAKCTYCQQIFNQCPQRQDELHYHRQLGPYHRQLGPQSQSPDPEGPFVTRQCVHVAFVFGLVYDGPASIIFLIPRKSSHKNESVNNYFQPMSNEKLS